MISFHCLSRFLAFSSTTKMKGMPFKHSSVSLHEIWSVSCSKMSLSVLFQCFWSLKNVLWSDRFPNKFIHEVNSNNKLTINERLICRCIRWIALIVCNWEIAFVLDFVFASSSAEVLRLFHKVCVCMYVSMDVRPVTSFSDFVLFCFVLFCFIAYDTFCFVLFCF